jgi:predicted DCC family thiol-disulfide oxidoreductase YuxK
MESAPPASDPLAIAGDKPLIVFDGLCVLCSANARFVLRHDRRRHFRLTTAQGSLGAALYVNLGLDPDATMLVIEDGRALTESDSFIAIARGLGWPWRAAAAAKILPKGVRDRFYRLIARNRFRLFGRRETCWVPAPGDAERIL